MHTRSQRGTGCMRGMLCGVSRPDPTQRNPPQRSATLVHTNGATTAASTTPHRQVLPDMSKGWADFGPAQVDGAPGRMWQLKELAGSKVNSYTFYVAEVR